MINLSPIGSSLKTIKLGLIGNNIAHSSAPGLHVIAGQQCGLDITYDLLNPLDLGKTFVEVFEMARTRGYRGLNITYPYKEQSLLSVSLADPLVQAIGAVNTVVFNDDGPQGYNTDYTGFIEAYRTGRGEAKPGIVCLIGAGGVGKAIAFGLLALGAKIIRCVDLDEAKAQSLADALNALNSHIKTEVHTDAGIAAHGADGVINCTPVGMVGLGGTPLPPEAMIGCNWAFDAVYTPVKTQFLTDARKTGLSIISGYEMFLCQGVDAWSIFSGLDVNKERLRAAVTGGLEY